MIEFLTGFFTGVQWLVYRGMTVIIAIVLAATVISMIVWGLQSV